MDIFRISRIFLYRFLPFNLFSCYRKHRNNISFKSYYKSYLTSLFPFHPKWLDIILIDNMTGQAFLVSREKRNKLHLPGEYYHLKTYISFKAQISGKISTKWKELNNKHISYPLFNLTFVSFNTEMLFLLVPFIVSLKALLFKTI